MILLVNSDSIRMPLADESVHCVVTSPPYWGLRDYGLPPLIWGGEAGCRHVWGNEIVKHRSSGGPQVPQTKWSNCESVVAAQRDTSSQFCQLCNAWLGCLGLEPTPELYVQHLVMVFREVWRVLRQDGTVWLNLGSSYWGGKGQSGHANPEYQAKRVEAGESFSQVSAHVGGQGKTRPSDGRHGTFKPKDLIPIPWLVALALQADGWWLRSDIIWHKPNCMPESVKDRPTTSHEYLFLLAKSKRYFYDAQAIVVPGAGRENFGQGQVKCHINKDRNDAGRLDMTIKGYRNRRTVWTIPTKPYKGAHFATFPPALVEPCIKAGTSERGVCPECGAQWERVTERKTVRQLANSARLGWEERPKAIQSKNDMTSGLSASNSHVWDTPQSPQITTTGWRPTCTCTKVYVCEQCYGSGSDGHGGNCLVCDGNSEVTLSSKPIPATVLDPFVGSGTTCLVARSLGRRSIGLDLSFAYLRDQARVRRELDRLTEWENGKQVEANWEELPLFQTS